MFDNYSEDYDNWYKTKMGKFIDSIETKAGFTLLNPKAGQNILDAGCGTGNYSIKLAEKGCHVTGIDVSENMLYIAKRKAKHLSLPLSFEIMDCLNLSFKENSFDGIISMAVFEFINSPIKAFQNLMSVLKPGGTLVIGTIQRGSPWQMLYSSEAFKSSVYSYAQFKSKDDMVSLDSRSFDSTFECLHIPPGQQEDDYSYEEEEKYKSQGAMGGFLCVKFTKVVR